MQLPLPHSPHIPPNTHTTHPSKAKWGSIDPASTASSTVTDMTCPPSVDGATGKLTSLNLPLAVKIPAGPDGVERAYYSAVTFTNITVLVELAFKAGFNGCKLSVRTDQPQYAELARSSIEKLLKM